MHNSYFALTLGVVALALLTDACGGKTDNGGAASGGTGGSAGGSGGATGGYGGGPVGGYGGMPAGGYGGAPIGGNGGMPAGGYGGTGGFGGGPVCPSYVLGGSVDMPACFLSDGSCGSIVSDPLSAVITLPQGCYPHDQPGGPDPSCPNHDYIDPLTQAPTSFAGCCRAATGTCGYAVDLAKLKGPNLGCIDSYPVNGVKPQPCGGTSPCSDCVQQKCQTEINTCMSNPECSQILQCLPNCVDAACANKCMMSFPGGQAAFMDFQNCAQANCQTECQ